jgi:uncharacterized membrane protein
MSEPVPDFDKFERNAHSDEIAVKTPWGLGKIRTRDLMTLLPWVAILAMLYLFGNEYLIIQRKAIENLTMQTTRQHEEILRTIQSLVDEQRIATYMSSLPAEKRPLLKMPRALADRLQDLP